MVTHDGVCDDPGWSITSGGGVCVFVCLSSVVQDAEVAGHDLVLEDGSIGDVNAGAVVGHDDHRAGQSHPCAERNITRHRQVVQLLQLIISRKEGRKEMVNNNNK